MCGEFFCRQCKQWDMITSHKCYIRRPEAKKPREILIIFDFECTQETGVHIPNLVVAQVENLKTHENTQVHFRSDDVSDEFGRWLFSEKHKNAIVTAHNMKGYDGYFLLNYLLRNGIRHNPIYAGSKIMSIHVESGLNMTIIDSLNFFPMPLSKLPKTFGLINTTKGDFSHVFNTKANSGYLGKYPPLEAYGGDTKSTEARGELLQWYGSVKDQLFDFEKQLYDYCVNDVDILARSIKKFRVLLMDKTGLDPLNYITIASTTMAVFKELFLEEVYNVNGELVKVRGGLDSTGKIFVQSSLALVPATGN